jgi:hypothetical protein
MFRRNLLPTFSTLAIGLTILLVGSRLSATDQQPEPSAEQAILAADDRFWQAASDHDVDTLANLLADQYFGLTPDGTRWDKASCLDQHQRVRTANLTRTSERHVHVLREDEAVLTYAAAYNIHGRDGSQLDSTEQEMTSYWVRRDGHWQVMFAHVKSLGASRR